MENFAQNTSQQIEEKQPTKELRVLKEYYKTVETEETIDGVPTPVTKQILVGRDVEWVSTFPDELAAMSANKEISEAKLYLRETDYIVLKIAEAVAEGDASEVSALQAEYAEQLSKRKQARAAVNANEESIIALQKGV